MRSGTTHDTGTEPVPNSTQLITIDDFAARLKCSTRHLRRLVEAGHAPAPVRLGALLRFDSLAVGNWIAAGCPRVQSSPEAGAP